MCLPDTILTKPDKAISGNFLRPTFCDNDSQPFPSKRNRGSQGCTACLWLSVVSAVDGTGVGLAQPYEPDRSPQRRTCIPFERTASTPREVAMRQETRQSHVEGLSRFDDMLVLICSHFRHLGTNNIFPCRHLSIYWGQFSLRASQVTPPYFTCIVLGRFRTTPSFVLPH